jgi:hypothetical protein
MDRMEHWSRRRFMGTSTDAAILAVLACTLRPPTLSAAEREGGITLFDPRFSASKPLAVKLAGAEGLRAIGSDVTSFVLQFVDARFRGNPLRLQGVTTESVPFCLRQLIPGARLTQSRVDRDLFAWTLEART